jgi:hypothetical protein
VTNTEYGIHEGDNLVSDAYGSRFAAEYELDHRTAPGGVWHDRSRSSFTVRAIKVAPALRGTQPYTPPQKGDTS